MDADPVNDVCNCSVWISRQRSRLRSWVLLLDTVNLQRLSLPHKLQGPMNRSRNFCRVFEAKFGSEERSKFMGSFDV